MTDYEKLGLKYMRYNDKPYVLRWVPVGEWLWDLARNGWADHKCSVCGWTKNTDIHVKLGYKFCPNCGAMMVKGGDAE